MTETFKKLQPCTREAVRVIKETCKADRSSQIKHQPVVYAFASAAYCCPMPIGEGGGSGDVYPARSHSRAEGHQAAMEPLSLSNFHCTQSIHHQMPALPSVLHSSDTKPVLVKKAAILQLHLAFSSV